MTESSPSTADVFDLENAAVNSPTSNRTSITLDNQTNTTTNTTTNIIINNKLDNQTTDDPIANTSTLRTQAPTRDFGFLPIPKRLRYDSNVELDFTLLLNVVFAFSSTFTVANLYYVQPILVALSQKFNVTYDQVVNIPTLLQASYALGLLFICPTGDLVRRRPLLLLLVSLTTCLTLILSLIQNLISFQILSFLIGLFSITPQILLPLSGDLSKPNKRASALSIVLSGLIAGIVLARVLSGTITQISNVSNVYFMSFGLQVLVWLMIYWFVPDVPAKNQDLSYFTILKTMAKFAFTEPLLIQSCFIGCLSSMIFSCFWVSSTFLLGDQYGYNELQIGLFGLIGLAGVCTAPFVGRLVDRLQPWCGVLIGIVLNMLTQGVYIGGASISIVAVVIVIFLLDVAQQLTQVSNSASVFGIGDAGRARRSAVYVFSIFVGQLVGTAVGTRIFLKGGSRSSGGFCLGLLGLMLGMLMLRGPMLPNNRWLGWQGGFQWTRNKPDSKFDPCSQDVESKVAVAESSGPIKD
ncbi:hypothetical protein OIO90_004153 [Microbotryomycetes sp. JL221]|nr:hypothetical protein OIO90_004153 [Microbotryomycetes sp. JL221]